MLKLREQAEAVEEAQKKSDAIFASAEAASKDKVWELKSKYYGGDRVLDYCLEGVKSSKANLFTKVKETVVDQNEVLRPIDELKQELVLLTSMEGKNYSLISNLPSLAITEEEERENNERVITHNSFIRRFRQAPLAAVQRREV